MYSGSVLQNTSIRTFIQPTIKTNRNICMCKVLSRKSNPFHTFSLCIFTDHETQSTVEFLRKSLSTIKENHGHLLKLLERGFQSMESVKVMIGLSEIIQQKYGELILQYQEYAFRHDCENLLWKMAFHNIITQFR